MQKIKVVENEEFTKAFGRLPVEQRARVTVVTAGGDRLVGEAGSGKDDLATPKSDTQIAEKFCSLTEDYLGTKRVHDILERLWHLEDMKNVATIPADFVLG
jgi:2-methylcitrate dehydratase PrpD